MIEKTPLDTYRESKISTIYIEMSRIKRYVNRYSLKIIGLERDFNYPKIPRETALTILNSIHSQYNREYDIVYSNLYTRTIIRDMMLYHIDNDNNHERKRNSMIDASRRDLQRFGKTPTKRVKGFKRPDPKTMPPIEKTW